MKLRWRWSTIGVVGLVVLGAFLGGMVFARDEVRVIPSPVLPSGYTAEVGIAKGADHAEVTREAISHIGGLREIVKPGEMVLIKPNLVGASRSGMGRITDYRVVQEIVNLAREAGAARILVSEGPVDQAWDYVYTVAGYKNITGAELHDLNARASECDLVRLEPSLTGVSWYIPKIWFEVDRIIDVAVMKTHWTAGVTLSLKNIGIGLPPQAVYGPGGTSKTFLHDRNIDLVIPEVNSLRKADLYVIDGMVGGEGQGPVSPTPRPMNLVLVSKDPVALDTIGTIVMGYDPREIAHLTYAAGIGLGTNDLAKITVIGENVDEVQAAPPFVRSRAADGAPFKKATVIKTAPSAISVDGHLSEWEEAVVNIVDDSTQVTEGKAGWHGPSDAIARFMFLHDGENLYFAIEAEDDVWTPADEVRLALSFTRKFKQQTNKRRYLSTASDIVLTFPLQQGVHAVTALNDRAAISGAQAVGRMVGNTCVVEGIIPLASLSHLPGGRSYSSLRTGDEIAVDLQFRDSDPGEPGTTVLMWSGGGFKAQDPSDMGRALVY